MQITKNLMNLNVLNGLKKNTLCLHEKKTKVKNLQRFRNINFFSLNLHSKLTIVSFL